MMTQGEGGEGSADSEQDVLSRLVTIEHSHPDTGESPGIRFARSPEGLAAWRVCRYDHAALVAAGEGGVRGEAYHPNQWDKWYALCLYRTELLLMDT